MSDIHNIRVLRDEFGEAFVGASTLHSDRDRALVTLALRALWSSLTAQIKDLADAPR